MEQMVNLCGKDNFKVRKDFDFYKVIIEVHFSDYGKVEELDYLMQTMLPVNMVINSKNNIDCMTDTNGKTYCAGCACVVRRFYITNDFRIETEIKKKIADIAKQAVDNYTAELLEQGVI